MTEKKVKKNILDISVEAFLSQFSSNYYLERENFGNEKQKWIIHSAIKKFSQKILLKFWNFTNYHKKLQPKWVLAEARLSVLHISGKGEYRETDGVLVIHFTSMLAFPRHCKHKKTWKRSSMRRRFDDIDVWKVINRVKSPSGLENLSLFSTNGKLCAQKSSSTQATDKNMHTIRKNMHASHT